MKVAVVGASGFVGAAVCEELRSHGHEVAAVSAPRIKALVYRPEDHEGAVEAMADEFTGAVAVVNCAGVPDASSQDEPLLFGANAVTPAVVARAVSRAGSPRLVHVSSAVVQGRVDVLDDSDASDAFSAYARSKLVGEKLVAQELHEDLVVYRPPSVHAADRRVTRTIARIASGPLRSVAGSGSRPSPQALIDNVASAIAYLALSPHRPPRVVSHPWEGLTTASLMEALGGRRPHAIPQGAARLVTGTLTALGRVMPRFAPTARRVEMLWFGQGQQRSWLTDSGWEPPVGPEGWFALRDAVVCEGGQGPTRSSRRARRAAALVSTTIPMTVRHFYGELIAIMHRDGYDVTIVSSSGHHLDSALRETGAQAHVIEMSRDITPWRDVLAWLQWYRLVGARNPEVVVAGTPKAALLAMTTAALRRVPRRVYLCGGLRLEGSRGIVRWILTCMERVAMSAATEVMVNSTTLKQEVLSHRLVDPTKLRQTLPGSTHGVDAERFAPRPRDQSLQDRFGIGHDCRVLGFVGRLTHDKGIDTLIEATTQLHESGENFHLLVVGPQNEPDSQAYVARLQRSGIKVDLVGPVEDVRPYYALLDALILPSLREGFPNVVLEAAAMGVPTITTTATGCRDAVIDGRTGILVPPRDSAALAEAVAQALRDPEHFRVMGRQARSWVATEFDPERIVGGWFHQPLGNGASTRVPVPSGR